MATPLRVPVFLSVSMHECAPVRICMRMHVGVYGLLATPKGRGGLFVFAVWLRGAQGGGQVG